MGAVQWVVALVCIGLFTASILGFAINFAKDNDAAVDISDDVELSGLYSDTDANLQTFSTESNATSSSILNTTIEPGSQTAQSSGPFTIAFPNLLGVVSNILEVGYYKIFGTGDGFGIFLTALIGLLAIITALYIWKALLGGPD